MNNIVLTQEQAQQIEVALVHSRICDYKYITQDPQECTCGVTTAHAIIQEALAEQAEQKPVAWRNKDTGSFCTGGFLCKNIDKWTPLYAAPVRTKDLTDDEIDMALGYPSKYRASDKERDDARAVIAKDREKNK